MQESQSELERAVFKRFAEHAGFSVTSIQSRRPPEPDLLCVTDSGEIYFELTDNTASQIQESVNARSERVKKESYWFSPFPDRYRAKFDKRYQTNSTECDLLIYFTLQPVSELSGQFDVCLEACVEWLREHLQQSVFRKVWLYDDHQGRVLACVEEQT